MLRRTLAAAVLLSGLLSLPAVAQITPDTARVLHLPDLLAEVQTANPSLRAARLEADALATRRAQVTALPQPTAGVVVQPFPVYTARGTQRSQWRVEQMIPYPGKLGLQGDIADLSAEVAGYEAATFAQDLVLEVKQLYTELYRIQEQTDLIAGFQEQLRRFEDVAATQYEVGTGMQQPILKAQLERHRLSIQQEKLAEARATTTEQLARLLNRPLDDLATARLAPPAFEAGPDTTLVTALARRPEVHALDAALERAERQIALARKQLLPDFMVNATYFDMAASDVPMAADGRDALAVGVGVKIPLWRGALRAGIEEAKLRRRQVEARQEALETSIRTQLADLTSRLDRQREQLVLLRETLTPQAEATLEATLSAYTTGRTDFLDLLDAERTLFTLRMETTDTLARLLTTSAALERTLGIAE